MTLLINTSEDYADEFDYPVISFFSSALKNYLLLKGFHYLTDIDEIEIGFGTNEELRFDIDQIKRMVSNAEELTEEALPYAKKYLNRVPSVDIVEWVLEKLYTSIEENDPDELANYNAILERHR